MAKTKHTKLLTGQDLFLGKDKKARLSRHFMLRDPSKQSGRIFYPGLPSPLQGTMKNGRPDFDLSHPDDWPQWVKNMDSEHLSVEVTKDGYLIFWAGTVHDGIFCGDEKTLWMGGCFRDGIVLGGEFWNIHWISGEKRGGNIHSGIWRGGIHRGGYFGGLWLGGCWMGGEFNGFRERTREAPPMYTSEQGMWPTG